MASDVLPLADIRFVFPFAARTGVFLTGFADFGEAVFFFEVTAGFLFAAGLWALAAFFGALFFAGRFGDSFFVERAIMIKLRSRNYANRSGPE
jgi:hypothetical protein